MGVYGVSPVESAFSVMGLVYAKALNDFFFVTTKLGWAIMLIGLFFAIWDSKKHVDFSYLWRYLVMVLIFSAFFIRPMAIDNIQSAIVHATFPDERIYQ